MQLDQKKLQNKKLDIRANSLEKVKQALKKVISPPSNYSFDEWALRFAVLSSEEANLKGKFNFDLFPMQREVYKEYSNPETKLICLRWGSQNGKTQFLKFVVAYSIHQDPRLILLVQPTIEMAKVFSKDRLDPMIRDMRCLDGLIAKAKSRDSGNTILHKKFIGGDIAIAGSNSPASLAMRPRNLIIGDEINRWERSAGKEGSPRKLMTARTTTFPNAKEIYTSSPTFVGDCQITEIFEMTDQRFYHVPCPICGHSENLMWENLKYKTKEISLKEKVLPDSIRYYFNCGHDIGEKDKNESFKNGIWIKTKEPVYKGYVGLDLWTGYSQVYTWEQLIDEYLECKTDIEKLKVFWNTKLNRLWEEKGESPDWEIAMARREFYQKNLIPKEGKILTCSIDVQIDRIELEIKAWGKRLENWSIDYRVIPGNPLIKEFWNFIDELLLEKFRIDGHDNLFLNINRIGIDTGNGVHTTVIYNVVRKYSQNPYYSKVTAIKGSSQRFAPILSIPKLIDKYPDGSPMPGGVYLYFIGTDQAKSEIYQSIRTKKSDNTELPINFMHFPDYDESYFKSLCSETLVARPTRTGRKKYYYDKKPGTRNEVLDLNVYNRALINSFGADRWTDDQWDHYFNKYVININTPNNTNKEHVIAQKQSKSLAKPINIDNI